MASPGLTCPACPSVCPESIVLQTECVCKTAPAPRRLAISTWRSVSADGLPPRRPTTRPRSSHSRMSVARSAPFGSELAVIARRSGRRDTTALKFPLVPSAHPRA